MVDYIQHLQVDSHHEKGLSIFTPLRHYWDYHLFVYRELGKIV